MAWWKILSQQQNWPCRKLASECQSASCFGEYFSSPGSNPRFKYGFLALKQGSIELYKWYFMIILATPEFRPVVAKKARAGRPVVANCSYQNQHDGVRYTYSPFSTLGPILNTLLMHNITLHVQVVDKTFTENYLSRLYPRTSECQSASYFGEYFSSAGSNPRCK